MILIIEAVFMSALWTGAVVYTAFVPTYAWWARRAWWREGIGWGMLLASLAVVLLLDLTLLFRVVEVSPAIRLAITTGVVVLIAVSGLAKMGALLLEIRRVRKSRKP